MYVCKATPPESALATINQALAIDLPPGGEVKKKLGCNDHFSSPNTLVVPYGVFEDHNDMINTFFKVGC